MKKLKVLIITLLMISIHSLGQGTGNTIPNKDTTVNIPKPAAQEVAKDLLRGDSAINELNLVKDNLKEERIKSTAKDSIISKKDQQIGTYKEKEVNWNNIITIKDEAFASQKSTTDKLAKDLRAIKRKKTFMEIAGTAIIGGLLYMHFMHL